jgi:iron complex transport system ATP-binding protein
MADVISGPAAEMALTEALASVTTLVPHLTALVSAEAQTLPGARATPGAGVVGGQWMIGQDLIDDPQWLGEVIRSTGPGIGTVDPVVAASLFVQGYSYRVLALTVACFVTSGVVPDTSAPRVAVALSGPWPSRVTFLAPAVLIADDADADRTTRALRFIHETAIDHHLAPLIDAVRSGLGARIGVRMLWGNVAASAATAFRTMQGYSGNAVELMGERFFDLAKPPLQGQGSFRVVESWGRRGWFWERTNCCLIDRLPGGIRCADCSLTPPAQRLSDYRAWLDAS